MSKTKAGEEFLVLDIHESGIPYSEADISEVYATVRDIIFQIPDYGSPEAGKSLDEYLRTSGFLRPDIKSWQFQFGDMRIKPQIDLVRYRSKTIHVIDWKVGFIWRASINNEIPLPKKVSN